MYRFNRSIFLRSRCLCTARSRGSTDLVVNCTKFWVEDFVLPHKLCPWAASVWNNKEVKILSIEKKLSDDFDSYVSHVVERVCEEAILLMDDDEVFDAPTQSIEHRMTSEDKENLLRKISIDDSFGENNSDDMKASDTGSGINVAHGESEVVKETPAPSFPGTPKTRNYSTVLIATPQFKEFDEFLNIVDIVEDSLAAADLTDYIQVASFHPHFEFGDSSNCAAGNYASRAPFPLIHLLRVDNVSAAIDTYVASKKGRNRGTKGPSDSDIMDNIWKRNIVRMKKLGEPKLKAQIVNIVKKAIAHSNQTRTKKV